MGFETVTSRIQMAASQLPSGAKRHTTVDPINSWFPYYAGYSLEFAEAMLTAADLSAGQCVFDPWNGSGTTTLAAARLGLRGCGFDLNPIAVMIAKSRLINTDDANGVIGFVRKTSNTIQPISVSNTDQLLKWFTPRLVGEFRAIQEEIIKNFATPESGEPRSIAEDHFPPIASFLLLALTKAAKSMVRNQVSSNPTIFKALGRSRSIKHKLIDSWLKMTIEMAKSLPQIDSLHRDSFAVVRDSRLESLPDNSIDFILTSPPYCTRLDYAGATNFELSALGPKSESEYQSLRRSLMGAPLVRTREKPEVRQEWPDAVKSTLSQIRTHPSKASESYYYKTYWQYFDDAITTLKKSYSALRPDGSAALIVQSSYYKNILIDLPHLYQEIGQMIGFRAEVVHEMPVRSVLSAIHPKTKVYRGNWHYNESIVLMHKGGQ